MQRAALTEIAAKAGHNLPIIRGRDTGLPSTAPVFDLEEMRNRNLALSKARERSGAERS